jgi:hypothetical protein
MTVNLDSEPCVHCKCRPSTLSASLMLLHRMRCVLFPRCFRSEGEKAANGCVSTQCAPIATWVHFYSVSNGGGKARATRTGELREPKSWRLLFLSSGEIPVETKLGEDRGRTARAGHLVRMLDLPADRERGFGVFDHGGPAGDASKLARDLKHAAISNYGNAGPEFVRRLIAKEVTGKDVQAHVTNFVAETVPARSDGEIERAAQ